MSDPTSPRAWLRWAARVLEAQSCPFSARLDHVPRGDFRLRDSRETAIDVKILLERAGVASSRNGVGARLLVSYYAGDAPWSSFSDREKRAIKKTARAFAEGLRAAGFLPEEG